MSAEFDEFIADAFKIKADIENPSAFTIAERTALKVLLADMTKHNSNLLAKAEGGRLSSRSGV